MLVSAFAKINLSLEVVGKYDTRYHEIKTILQTVGIRDIIEIRRWSRLRVECDVPSLGGSNNLVWKAAHKLAKHAGIPPQARIFINKQIPMDSKVLSHFGYLMAGMVPLFFGIILFTWISAGLLYYQASHSAGEDIQTMTVIIPPGATLHQISNELKDRNLILSASSFRLLANIRKNVLIWVV